MMLQIIPTLLLWSATLTVVTSSVNFTAPTGILYGYGLFYEPFDKIQASREEWQHTLVIDIPKIKQWPDVVIESCKDTSNSLCTNIQALQKQLQSMKEKTQSRVDECIDLLMTTFPNDKSNGTKSGFSMEHRSLPMSTKDLRALQSHLDKVHSMSDDIPNSFHVHNMPFSSVMKHHLANVDKLTKSIKQNHDDLAQYAKYSEDFFKNYSDIIAAVLETKEALDDLETDVRRLVDSFMFLKINRLSPLLLSPSDVNTLMSNVQQQLNNKYPGFEIINDKIDHFYNIPVTLTSRQDDEIHITLQIPISQPQTMLHSFRIRTFPVEQSSGDITHYTELEGMPPYFLISEDGQFFGSMSAEEMSECKGYGTRVCRDSIPMTSVNHPTCAAALFLNKDPEEIARLCSFAFVQSDIPPQILEASENEVVAVNISSFEIKCGDTTTTHDGCTSCIITLECSCILQTERYVVNQRIGKCKSAPVQTKVLYPVNTASVHYFGNERVKRDLQGKTLLEEKLHLPMPQVEVFRHPFTDSIVSDDNPRLDLKSVAEAAKNGKPVYNSLAERILNGDVEIAYHWWSVPGMLDLANLILTSICCMFTFCLFCKFRELRGYVHPSDVSGKQPKMF